MEIGQGDVSSPSPLLSAAVVLLSQASPAPLGHVLAGLGDAPSGVG